jgi:hypothetical protein
MVPSITRQNLPQKDLRQKELPQKAQDPGKPGLVPINSAELS